MFSLEPFDPEDALPPEQMRITELRVEPWTEDNRRVRVHLAITPYQQRPNLDVIITDSSGEEVASISIIEAMDLKIVFTMHLRVPDLEGTYTVTGRLSYEDMNPVDQRSFTFELHETPDDPA